MRVLDFVTMEDGPLTVENGLPSTVHGQEILPLWAAPATKHPFPLSENSRTEPHLAIKPHAGMVNGLEKTISNQEEIKPSSAPGKSLVSFVPFVVKGFYELPLVIFTLCGQMAAGMAVFSLFPEPLTIPLLAFVGGLIGIGGLVSLLHLGNPWNAWTSVNHLKKSWLSREILMFGLFGVSWLVALALPGMGKLPLALSGFGLVYSMARVYRLRAVPAWDSWRTNTAFFMAAGILGLPGVGLGTEENWTWFLLLALLVGQLALVLSAGKNAHGLVNRIRVALILTGMAGAGMLLLLPGEMSAWLSILIFLIVLAEESIGRWHFYASRTARM
jgi:DMSO reductase anchor subunit